MRTIGDNVRGAVSRVPAVAGIGQDDVIFAMIAFAFVVWITTKGELPIYLAFFKPGTGTPGPTPVTVAASSTSGQFSTAANPVVGTVIGAGNGQPGLNINNPFAGIPGLGQTFQSLLPGNSNGAAAPQVPGQANPIPWGQVGTWLKSFL